jgi:isocitrate dehydrogenase kinase/phosphatase
VDESASSSAAALTDSRLAALCAQTARQSFLDYQERFHQITRRARARFLARAWVESYADATERLKLYSAVLDGLTSRIRDLMGERLSDRSVWAAIKAVYSSLIADSSEWEIAESFFNSLTRRVFATEGVDQSIEFVDTDFDAPPTSARTDVQRRYSGNSLPELLRQMATDAEGGGFEEKCWRNLSEATRLGALRIQAAFTPTDSMPVSNWKLEMIGSAFYRGRGAYLVGRVFRNEDEPLAVAFCLRHENDEGVALDAILIGENDLAILFSFTRAYFRVESRRPYDLVRYLRLLMPRKRLNDLYNSIGHPRHGKTEFYRNFVAHLKNSNDRFAIAEGTPGMVMLVFTLPSYDVVFKLIKDRFDYPKDASRADVMRRYRLVFEHDRGGRLVEAHEFEHLRIARNRFEPALLEDMRQNAAATVRLDGDDVVIGQAYVERRVRPLNLFFAEHESCAQAKAGRDYGQSIKDLAASNIFPGDLLTKNFGVTRHDRVVFYDYDELTFLTDCNFRDLPQATTYEEEMSAEPWFSVRDNDIFPEEFPRFLGLPESARTALFEQHADLFAADFWRELQGKLRAGEILEVFPYGEDRRLTNIR